VNQSEATFELAQWRSRKKVYDHPIKECQDLSSVAMINEEGGTVIPHKEQ